MRQPNHDPFTFYETEIEAPRNYDIHAVIALRQGSPPLEVVEPRPDNEVPFRVLIGLAIALVVAAWILGTIRHTFDGGVGATLLFIAAVAVTMWAVFMRSDDGTELYHEDPDQTTALYLDDVNKLN